MSSASAEWLVITASNDSGVTSNSNWLEMASTDTTSYEFDIHTANTSIYGALSGAAFDTSESIGHGTAAAPQLVDDGYVFQTYLVPVPEPFSVSLLLCGSIFMLARRARS